MPALKKIVFFGTPEFAVPTLEAMVEAGRAPIKVFTQPTRPAGRGKTAKPSPVAEWAREHGLEVEEVEKVSDEKFLAELATVKPDLAVVVAFGQIFPQELLELPKKGCVNLHASLLPKFRGAAPIQAAIMEGMKKTGVTTMQMTEELDAGPILLQEDEPIRIHDNSERLSKRLASLGAEVTVETIAQLEKGKLKPRQQKDEQATYAPRITKEEGRANWALEAKDFYNRLRAFVPWPGTTARFRGRPVKLLWAVPMDWEEIPIGTTGTYLGMRQGRLAVLCGSGTMVGLERLQRPGKQAISAAEFANGEHLRVGERFV